MLRLEDFGITPAAVTEWCIEGVISILITCAVGILLTCLFGLGLYRKAIARGEKKPVYAFLPLLRLYTLGKMAPGSEKTKKVFACLMPSLAIVTFVSAVITGALLIKTAMAMIFTAEEVGGAIKLESLLEVPINYCIIGVIITAALAVAMRVLETVCLYGAFEETGKKRMTYTLLSFFITPLAAVLLYTSTKQAKAAPAPAEASEPEAK